MNILHITEIFALDGRVFITQAYLNLLRREPDEHGMAYYLGRLAQGYGKAAVIVQLSQSPECRPLNEIKGLKKLIADERRAQHWFFGIFFRHSRIEKLFASYSDFFVRLGQCVDHSRVTEQVCTQLNYSPKDEIGTEFINESIISDLYIGLLGRQPESAMTVEFYKNIGNLAEIVKEIISSEEFRSNFSKKNNINFSNASDFMGKNNEPCEGLSSSSSIIAGINSLQRTPLEKFYKF